MGNAFHILGCRRGGPGPLRLEPYREGGGVLRRLWDRHGDRMRHWLAVVITIVVVLVYMDWRDTADWTVFVLAIGLLLALEFLLQGDLLRRGTKRNRRPQ